MRILIPYHAGPDNPSGSAGDVTDEQLSAHYAYPPSASNRCWLRANFVAALDGAAQGPDHHSGSLSAPADRRILALLRSLCDVILVGAATVRTERYGPVTLRPEHARLRAARGSTTPPPIAVVSRSLEIPDGLLRDPRTLVFPPASTSRARQARLADQVEVVPTGGQDVDLQHVVAALRQRGHTNILTEGGPRLFAELTQAGLVDELCLTTAPLVVGGDPLRITHGPATDPLAAFDLAGLAEESGYVFGRWIRRE